MKREEKMSRLKVVPGSSSGHAACDVADHYATGHAKLLMITDFSRRAVYAESRAAMLCIELGGRPLEVMALAESASSGAPRPYGLAVLGKEDVARVSDMEAGLRAVSQRLQERESLSYTCAIRFGEPTAAVIERAEALNADLIVVGVYNGSIGENLARGYSTTDLVRALDRPTLVVKNDPAHAYRSVLIAVDFTESSRRAAMAALQLAPEARHVFLHVVDDVRSLSVHAPQESNEDRLMRRMREDQGISSRLSAFIKDLPLKPGDAQAVARRGHPSSTVLDYAKEMDADLVVCSKRSDTVAHHNSIGGMAMELLIQSHCDVLIVAAPNGMKPSFDRPAA